MKLIRLLALLVEVSTVSAQSLLNATANYSQLSDFRQLLMTNPNAASRLLTNVTLSADQKITVLIPNNDAFTRYQRNNGMPVSALASSDLANVLDYHSLQGSLSSSDLQQPMGLVAATALTNQTYDNRGLASSGAKIPQVVYISSVNTANGTVTTLKGQTTSPGATFDIKSGEGLQTTLEPVNGAWSGGLFQIVNSFLTLPVNQTITMASQGLNSFVSGLALTDVTEGTNAAPGLTCVCPADQGFAAISDLFTHNLTDGPGSLLATLRRHGLTGSFYTTNFTDGSLIHSQNGYAILVTQKNGSIFLNDAKIVGSNYIANSGCIHALDRVMGFLNTTTNITTPANASIYSNASNIPAPTPLSNYTTSSTIRDYTMSSTIIDYTMGSTIIDYTTGSTIIPLSTSSPSESTSTSAMATTSASMSAISTSGQTVVAPARTATGTSGKSGEGNAKRSAELVSWIGVVAVAVWSLLLL